MIATDQSLSTNLNKCASLACHRSCNKQGCDLCLPCLTGSEYDMLYRAHMEHLHRGNMRRLFPPSFVSILSTACHKLIIKYTSF